MRSRLPNCGFRYSSTGVPITSTTTLLLEMTDAGPVVVVSNLLFNARRRELFPFFSLNGNFPFLILAIDFLFMSKSTVRSPASAKETPSGNPICPAPPMTQTSKVLLDSFFMEGYYLLLVSLATIFLYPCAETAGPHLA